MWNIGEKSLCFVTRKAKEKVIFVVEGSIEHRRQDVEDGLPMRLRTSKSTPEGISKVAQWSEHQQGIVEEMVDVICDSVYIRWRRKPMLDDARYLRRKRNIQEVI